MVKKPVVVNKQFSWQRPESKYKAKLVQPTEESKPRSKINYLKVFGVSVILLVPLYIASDWLVTRFHQSDSYQRLAQKLEKELADLEKPTNDKLKKDLSLFKKKKEKETTRSVEKVSDPESLVELAEVKARYIRAVRADGKIELRTGGSINWRTNNPGQLQYSDFAKERGALGKYSGKAIFPSYDKGKEVFMTLLFETEEYGNSTVEAAMNKFAPRADKFNPSTYIKKITKAVDKPKTTLMKDMSPGRRDKIIRIIRQLETWQEGEVRIYDSVKDWKAKGF